MSHYPRNSASIVGFHFQPSYFFSICQLFSVIQSQLLCVCVCVYVCKNVRGGSIRCGLEAGDREAVLGGYGGTSFQYYQAKQKTKHYALIIPLSDWTIIYFASMLANSVISSILALSSSCTVNPCLQHPCLCVWSVYTRYIIKYIFDVPLSTWFTVFIICGLL